MGICLIVAWFAIQMPNNMEVGFSDHHLVNGEPCGGLDVLNSVGTCYYCFIGRLGKGS